MTSQSRRKRQITPLLKLPATVRSGLCLLVAAALLIAAAASATADDDLQWRSPKVNKSSASTNSLPKTNTLRRSAKRWNNQAATQSRLATRGVRPVKHESRASAKAQATDVKSDHESPKLKSVLVANRKLTESERITTDSQRTVRIASSDGAAEGSEDNRLRSAPAEGPMLRPTPRQFDPFESSTSDVAARDASTDDFRASGSSRQVQHHESDEDGRSVLVHDPFDTYPNDSLSDEPSPPARFINQPMNAPDSAEPIQDQPYDSSQPDGPTVNGFEVESYQDQLREQSERACQEALEALRESRISNIDLTFQLQGTPGEDLPYECALDTGEYRRRNFAALTYMWKASALCHKPLYFEDVHLERYGHSWGWHAQPFVSAAHFFVTVPILPYKMGLKTPNECVYTLGHYRVGNCAPYLIEPLGWNPRAVVWQAGAVVGAAAIVP